MSVSERRNRTSDRVQGAVKLVASEFDSGASARKNARRRKLVLEELQHPVVRQALAALGHPMRVRILAELLDGPTVYQALAALTGLRPGPLYHHINQLRLGGLITPKERNLYELTRGGRNLILIVAAARNLLADRRARPSFR